MAASSVRIRGRFAATPPRFAQAQVRSARVLEYIAERSAGVAFLRVPISLVTVRRLVHRSAARFVSSAAGREERKDQTREARGKKERDRERGAVRKVLAKGAFAS